MTALNLAVVGECMLEFYQQQKDLFRLGFAGDAYNVAVYFVRCVETDVKVQFVTALGTDSYSQRMLAEWRHQGVGVDYVRFIEKRMPGLYLVETDDVGERDFHYYRQQSAARIMFDGDEGTALLQRLFEFDYVYFSGITLAILEAESRQKWISILADLKKAGIVIYFDTNYRPKLWPTPEEARACMESVLPYVDVALPSFTDMYTLYGDRDIEACVDRYLSAGVKKLVITQGDMGYMLADREHRRYVPVDAVQAIDTTGAGDSFNAAYLAYTIEAEDDLTACQKAAALAREVVQHRGAIL